MSDQNALQSIKNDIKRLENQAAELKEKNRLLKIEVDGEVKKLERLRNEETHIQGELKSLSIAKSDHENQKLEDAKKLSAERASVDSQIKIANEKLVIARNAQKDASDKLNAAQSRLVAAETIEKRNSEDQNNRQRESIAIENQKAALSGEGVRLSDKKKSLESLIQNHKDLLSENTAIKKEIQKQRSLYDAEIAALGAVRKENERILAEAEALNAKASGKMIAADEKLKAGQLSVDRQWNEIEIQKKRLEVMQLKIDKLIKDNDLEAELMDLRKKA